MYKKLSVSGVLLASLAVMSLLWPGGKAYAGVYNRSTAVSYADTWAKSRNSNYPNYGTGDGCNDCTNYVSQVLHNGGVPQISGSDDAFHWYTYKDFWGTWKGSKSWAATDWFNTHASQFQSTRYQYYSSGPSTLSSGDFFLMDLPTNPFQGPDHARVIVGWGTVLEGDQIGQYKLLANQHCVDRKRVRWDYNLPAGTLLWAWHVIY
jgi:Putative amidase domain